MRGYAANSITHSIESLDVVQESVSLTLRKVDHSTRKLPKKARPPRQPVFRSQPSTTTTTTINKNVNGKRELEEDTQKPQPQLFTPLQQQRITNFFVKRQKRARETPTIE